MYGLVDGAGEAIEKGCRGRNSGSERMLLNTEGAGEPHQWNDQRGSFTLAPDQ